MECLNCGAQLGDKYGQVPLCRDCLRLPIDQIVIRVFGGHLEVDNNVSDN